MNPIVRHYLPSVVRGVYRTDDAFSSIEDNSEYQRFIEEKLRFLPPSVTSRLRGAVSRDRDLRKLRSKIALSDDLVGAPQAVSQRANLFFASHSYFENAVDGAGDIRGADNYLEVQFVRRILAVLLTDEGLKAIRPQHQVGPYYVDFAVEGESKIVIEVDGFGKFKDRDSLDQFTNRQNYLVQQKWRVLRFSYNQIIENTPVTLKQVHSLFKNDERLRKLLAVSHHSGFLLRLQERMSGPFVLDIVNNFFGIQDHFVEHVLGTSPQEGVYRIEDKFSLDWPIVAVAISSLYRFLDAIEKVIKVDFEVPRVEIFGGPPIGEWLPELHALVSLSQSAPDGTEPTFDSELVGSPSPSLPAPTADADDATFVSGLSLEQLKQRLNYFTSELFGYSNGSKPFQDKIIQRVFNGQPVVGIAATGSGKSFCFWLPALLKPGLTLVICPLRSLMRDQRLTLRRYGIASAEFINSDIDNVNQRRILEEAKLGYIRLLYISPERLRIKKFLASLEELQSCVPINFIAIDEAHCISEWGHDFRPSYLKLPFLRDLLMDGGEGPQLIALTATAGQQVEKDILGILRLDANNCVIRERVSDRERFSYQILVIGDSTSKSDKYRDLLTTDLPRALKRESLSSILESVNKRHEKSLGIVFCIYADPHGRHSIRDGVAHYLYETMGLLEPDNRWELRRHRKQWHLDAYSTGRVRAFSSKPPTLCPKCQSYAYVSKSGMAPIPSVDEDDIIDDEELSAGDAAGLKVCNDCGHEFEAENAVPPPKWQELVKLNQNEFKESGFDILVATKGFGMGIDKSSVRFIVHTSLSSGLESWYQEVGRAGRDNERAHIVLLVDSPNEPCRAQLAGLEIKRPLCSYSGGCPHGKPALCDYGKQHMFISRSYPGAESDAVSALRMLDKLITPEYGSNDGTVIVRTSNAYLSQSELALYRLAVLGLVRDYVITYRRSPEFEVTFDRSRLTDRNAMSSLAKSMKNRLGDYLAHFDKGNHRDIAREVELREAEYRPIEEYSSRTKRYRHFKLHEDLFRMVYQHLLVLLDHTYKDVVKMRYDMLWNLETVVSSTKCRRLEILPHFGEKLDESYRCGCCDRCSPNLDFPESRIPPKFLASPAEEDIELDRVLNNGDFVIEDLDRLRKSFSDYPTAKYRQARSVLEGDANNLPALFMSREFSPPDEYEANSKRLLRTANQKTVTLADIERLYESTRISKAEILSTLNEAGTTCDSVEGWRFLAKEINRLELSGSRQLGNLRECLEFMLIVDDDLSRQCESLRNKATELEKAFYA